MTDKELLELAAKAAGILLIRSRLDDQLHKDMLAASSARNPHHENGPWNPLTDDGDALRLANALQLCIAIGRLDGTVVVTSANNSRIYAAEPYETRSDEATRRAIVRAAAEIGKR